ncbi:N-formylglutamate deformylase [Zavarzinia compransoris]|uniref:N-formylglutamate deformylase n=1 Tax=Zavarzinia marina TaxID=2911065 RepID=UPI001F2C144C|nr:N-formylglutamate deformylase [Zavarzinia marina]MCF4167326.1 N-formylglutamate deformylase [Zavarzinia marina]
MTPVGVIRGDGPVILGQPHGGTFVPNDIAAALNATGRALADTDWHIDRLYDGLLPGATVVHANFHRYVIDANRDPSGRSLYPGQNTTGLVPETDFDGRPIWKPGQAPDAAEVERRRLAFHAPYHAALAAEVERLRTIHPMVVLYDCHSIRSDIPFLFEGRLPVFNIGNNAGATCSDEILTAVAEVAKAAGRDGFDHVVNGRFKGGWTTRHYGRPETGVHAIQMELGQRAYLSAEAAPWSFDPAVAGQLRPYLRDMLQAIEAIARRAA